MVHWELSKKLKFDHTKECCLTNLESLQENEMHKLLWKFWETNRSFNIGQTTRHNNQQWKESCRIVDFTVSAHHRVKLKEREKKDKYLDLAWELKKLWNMKVTFILIVIDALGTVTKGLSKGLKDLEIGGQVETIKLHQGQTTSLPRSAITLRRVLETWGDLLSLKLQWKPSANAGEKNSNRSEVIIRHGKVCHVDKDKREKRNNWKDRTTKSGKQDVSS